MQHDADGSRGRPARSGRASTPRAGANRAPGRSPAGRKVANGASADASAADAVDGRPSDAAVALDAAAPPRSPRGRTAAAHADAPAAAASASPALEATRAEGDASDADDAEVDVVEVEDVPDGDDVPELDGSGAAELEAFPEPFIEPVREGTDLAIAVRGLTKRFAGTAAVDGIDLDVPAGSFFGFVGPNGAGKTTTLAMITGMLRPDSGEVRLHGVDVWRDASVAKRQLGVLPDRLRLFDRLTGVEFLHHAGALRGLDRATILQRTADLAITFGIEHSLDRFVSDYSAGMVKKLAIAAAMIHSPRVLVLDEPFESVDPVSSAIITGILERYVAAGGTVMLSSHSMELIERTCDAVAIIVEGRLLASGRMESIVGESTLERRFVELAGGSTAVEGMEWLQSFSD